MMQEKVAIEQDSSSLVHQLLLKMGKAFFRFRNALFPIIFLAVPLVSLPGRFVEYPGLGKFLATIGISLALFGQFFRFFVIGYDYIKRGGKDGKIYADSLVTSGLYAHSRNPMYLGNICIAVGLSLLYGSPFVVLFIAPFFVLAYLAIVVAEEEYLGKQFGEDYRQYLASVPRFIPRVSGIGKTIGGHLFDWRKALRSEYGTAFGTFSAIVLLSAWHNLRVTGEVSVRSLIASILAEIIVLSLYLAVRSAKKSGRLSRELTVS